MTLWASESFRSRELEPILPGEFISRVLVAPAKSISFRVSGNEVFDTEVSSLTIAVSDLSVDVDVLIKGHPVQFVTSFFRQVSNSNNNQLAKLRWNYQQLLEGPVTDPVARPFVEAVGANQNLKALELPNTVHWAAHIEALFGVMENHRSMRIVKLDRYPVQADPQYAWLKRLLRRNWHIVVKDENDMLITDGGSVIRRQYLFNRFRNRSLILHQTQPLIRPFLIFETLIQRAENDFQRIAVLLAEHTDTLCEMLQLFKKANEMGENTQFAYCMFVARI